MSADQFISSSLPLPKSAGEYRLWWTKNAVVPYGYCWCGCGEKTSVVKGTDRKALRFKDESVRFRPGHDKRLSKNKTANPGGFCECGCGQLTSLSNISLSTRGWVKGQPVRFISGHNSRLSEHDYLVEDRGYETACWIWQRMRREGYGRVRTGSGMRQASRVYYEKYIGLIPEGLYLDHLCVSRTNGHGGSTSCVRPSHLEPVTAAENTRRGRSTKLTPMQVHEMRRRAFFGESYESLAKEFGISRTYAGYIVSRRNWRDI